MIIVIARIVGCTIASAPLVVVAVAAVAVVHGVDSGDVIPVMA